MKQDKKSLAALVGASIVTSLSAGVVNAAENPFVLKDLAQGYLQVAEVVPYQGKPGEPAKLAEAAKAAPEMKCGAEIMKNNPEMKCGASMMKGMDAPAAAPADAAKAVEKKCAGMKMEKPATPAAPPAAK
ncbi:MAG: hypothetical protein WCI11_16960 [Candidatus Methylumidiphilus sp.]